MDNQDLRIIIIDDNPAIHRDFIKVLTPTRQSKVLDAMDEALFGDSDKQKGAFALPKFQFDTASQGQEGVEKIKKAVEEGAPYALAFVDIRMPPGWNGIETIKHIWKIDPDIQVVICTAYSDYSWEETVHELGMSDNYLILKKPFDNVAVRQLGSALTRKWLLNRDSKNHTESLHRIVQERTESLQQSLSLLRATLESSNDGILVVNLEKELVDYNTQFVNLLEIPDTILTTKDENILQEYMRSKLQNSEEYSKLLNELYQRIDDVGSLVIKLKDGKILQCCSQPHLVKGITVGRVWSFRDITERSFLEKELEHQAKHDVLTDLPNRVLLTERIKHAIAECSSSNSSFAILFFDLDRFKLVNDSLSHEFGDRLLCAVTKRLSSLIRKSDTLARLGGDEFVMVIHGPIEEDDLVNLAHKLVMSFKLPFKIGEQDISTSTSIGISRYPYDGKSINKLLKSADLAMYQAKEQGGNQFKFYSPSLNQQNNKRLQQENELRQAIANNEFFLLYQPQLDLDTDKLMSVEALIRWSHPKKGVILPINFIQQAEDSGLIVPIGEWVLREACRQIRLWHKNGLPNLRVAVNVATQQLKQSNFAETVQNILEEYKVEPQYIELEITENVIITHIEVMQMINKLKKVGVKIVLDDFGTGNSSLNYLKQIHFDRLKIDRSFVHNIFKSRSDKVIIEAIIAMARSLNFKVMAEGVENKKQLKFLKNQQCDEIQGFIYSRPITPELIEQFLKDKLNKPENDN